MDSLPTPSYPHLKNPEFVQVYEPAEDTFIVLDALEKDKEWLLNMKPRIAIEIGPGSGVVITFLAQLLGDSCVYFGCDLNISACQATRKTAEINGVSVQVIHTNLLDTMEERLEGKVDVLVFNPPYVPTDPEELGRDDLYAAWAGGADGREVIDVLLPKVHRVLKTGGCFYLMVILENKPKEIVQFMKQNYGFRFGGVILKRQARNELLHVLKFEKID